MALDVVRWPRSPLSIACQRGAVLTMQFYLLLTFFTAAYASLKYRNNLDATSRLAQRSCGTPTESRDANFLGPFIVHLMDHMKHDEFEQNIKSLQQDQHPFTASTVKVSRLHTVFHSDCSVIMILKLVMGAVRMNGFPY